MTLTKREKDLLKKFVEKCFKEAQMDSATFDLEAHIDSSLSYAENKELIKAKLKELGVIEPKMTKKELKEIEEYAKTEQMKRYQTEQEEKEKKALEKIAKSPPNIEQYFAVPKNLVRAFLSEENREVAGMILRGSAGIGKSYMCIQVFNEKGWKLGEEYNILSGYITPLKLYAFLYKNKDKKVVLFDDISGMFENDASKSLLLSALWNTAGKRFVSYLSSSDKLVDEDGNPIPPKFLLNAKILWCVNDLPPELENIKSRCYYYELDFDYYTRIKIIYEICKINKIPLEIAKFIEEYTNEAYEIDFRLPLKLFGLYKANKDSWQELAKAIVKADEDLMLVRELLQKHSTIKEAVKEYQSITGHSRATFFRRKKMLMKNIFFRPEVSKSQSIISENGGENEV